MLHFNLWTQVKRQWRVSASQSKLHILMTHCFKVSFLTLYNPLPYFWKFSPSVYHSLLKMSSHIFHFRDAIFSLFILVLIVFCLQFIRTQVSKSFVSSVNACIQSQPHSAAALCLDTPRWDKQWWGYFTQARRDLTPKAWPWVEPSNTFSPPWTSCLYFTTPPKLQLSFIKFVISFNRLPD